jgi:hypothetical protein
LPPAHRQPRAAPGPRRKRRRPLLTPRPATTSRRMIVFIPHPPSQGSRVVRRRARTGSMDFWPNRNDSRNERAI